MVETKKVLSPLIDIFVPQPNEQRYLQNHNIAIRHLPNGAVLAGATRHVEDQAHASITVTFPSASVFEPIGKRGVSHLTEHFIAAQDNEAYYNAETSISAVALLLNGAAHPQVRDYGIWPVLPVALDQVTKPQVISERGLETEKAIVIDEMHQRLHGMGMGWKDYSLLMRSIYPKDHPYFHVIIGSESEVQSLTREDIAAYQRSIFIPRGLEALVFAEGGPEISTQVLDEFEKRIEKMPDLGIEPQRIDLSPYQINDAYGQGEVYWENTQKPYEPNGRQQIHYTWLVPEGPFDPQSSARSRFMGVAYDRAFRAEREAGMAYTFSPISIPIGDKQKIMGFSLDIRKVDDPLAYAQQAFDYLKPYAFDSFDQATIEDINRLIHKRVQAVPISVHERFSDTIEGLRDYGRIIDTEKKNSIQNSFTSDDLLASQDYFSTTPPTIIVEGDLA